MNQKFVLMSYLFKQIFIKISTQITGNKNIKFPHINQLWRTSLEFLKDRFLWLIHWKFSKIDPQFQSLFGDQIFVIKFWEIPEFFPRNYEEYLRKFHRNFQELELVTNFKNCLRNRVRDFVSINFWEFLWNIFTEIP